MQGSRCKSGFIVSNLRVDMKMCCGRSCECFLKWSAVSLVACALFVGGVRFWLSEKHYVFSAEELASITTKALEKNKGGKRPQSVII